MYLQHYRLFLRCFLLCFGALFVLLNVSLWINRTSQWSVGNEDVGGRTPISPQLVKLLQERGFSIEELLRTKKYHNEVLFPLNFTKTFSKGVKVDIFQDVCIDKVMYNLKWHPLFPSIPAHSNVYQSLDDRTLIQHGFARRVYGYLVSDRTGDFEILAESRDGIEISIRETGVSLENAEKLLDNKIFDEVVHAILDQGEIDHQMATNPNCYMFKKNFRLILRKHKIYFIEILQGGRHYGQMKISWRENNDEEFVSIGPGNLFFINTINEKKEHYPLSRHFRRPIERFSYNENEARRMNFMNIHPVPEKYISNVKKCEPYNISPKRIENMYDGIRLIDNFLVHPQEHFQFTSEAKIETILMNEGEAKEIGTKIFDALHAGNSGSSFTNLVHIQKNIYQSNEEIPNWRDKLYFAEIDVKLDNTPFRFSNFFQHNNEKGEVCMMADFQWKHHVKIHIITPVRNQANWVKHLISNIKDITKASGDNKMILHIIDFESSDANLEEILKHSNLNYVYVNMVSEKFNKVKAINTALQDIAGDEIAFIVDLHLVLPLNIFDRIRKLTIQGKTAYCPSLLKLGCGEHEQYTDLQDTQWMDIGYGMVSMYSSDWKKVGGMNEKEFGAKWGGEDWELVDRIVSNGLFMIHMRLPRFYHIHHSNEGLWDGRKYA